MAAFIFLIIIFCLKRTPRDDSRNKVKHAVRGSSRFLLTHTDYKKEERTAEFTWRGSSPTPRGLYRQARRTKLEWNTITKDLPRSQRNFNRSCLQDSLPVIAHRSFPAALQHYIQLRADTISYFSLSCSELSGAGGKLTGLRHGKFRIKAKNIYICIYFSPLFKHLETFLPGWLGPYSYAVLLQQSSHSC